MIFGWWSWVGALTSQSPDGDSGHGAGLASTLKLPAVRGGELVWACLQPPSSAAMC